MGGHSFRSYLTTNRFEVDTRLNKCIGDLKVEGMSGEAKFAIVKFKHELSKVLDDIGSFRKQVLASIEKPEGLDELRTKVLTNAATEEEKAKFEVIKKEYTDKCAAVALPYFSEEIAVPFEFISEEDFKSLLSHNDINTVEDYEYLYSKLVKK